MFTIFVVDTRSVGGQLVGGEGVLAHGRQKPCTGEARPSHLPEHDNVGEMREGRKFPVRLAPQARAGYSKHA